MIASFTGVNSAVDARESFGPFVVIGTTLGMMAFQSGPADVIGHCQ